MKKLRLLASFVLILLMFTMVSSVAAQSYSFNLTREVVNVYWNSDGTMALDYVFTFANDPGGHVIDFVDVGMPNGNFDFGTITADVGGNSVSLSSDFQGDGPYGFSVDMGAYAIQPGQTGSVHVYVGQDHPGALNKDTSDPTTYDSGELSPAYFTTAHGNTDLTVIFHLPPGVQPQEPRYHATQGGWPCADQPATGYDDQNRITYTWQCSTANGSTQYTFGASFPNQYVPADAIYTPPAVRYQRFPQRHNEQPERHLLFWLFHPDVRRRADPGSGQCQQAQARSTCRPRSRSKGTASSAA